jgi:hypothetical protein
MNPHIENSYFSPRLIAPPFMDCTVHVLLYLGIRWYDIPLLRCFTKLVFRISHGTSFNEIYLNFALMRKIERLTLLEIHCK